MVISFLGNIMPGGCLKLWQRLVWLPHPDALWEQSWMTGETRTAEVGVGEAWSDQLRYI